MYKKNQRGFTLIELLVVVLIMGILAAVALPQYQKAVGKARAVQMVQFLREGRNALNMYVLEHGFEDVTFYASRENVDNLDKLSVDLAPLANTLVNEYGFVVSIGLFAYKETMISLTGTSSGKYNVGVAYGLVEGEWGGICSPNSAITNGMCEAIHNAFPEIIIN